MNDGQALLRAILIDPADDAPRLVFADWLDDNAVGDGPCPQCCGGGSIAALTGRMGCMACSPDWRRRGSGIVPGNGFAERAEFIRDCCQIMSQHTDCPVRIADAGRGRPTPLRCGSCRYCTARRRAERFYSRHPWIEAEAYAVAFEPTPFDGPLPTGPGITLTVRRGFVETISLPTAAFLAHAAALFAAHPVTAVWLTDREPDASILHYDTTARQRFCWFNEMRWGGLNDPANLPWGLFDALRDDVGDGFDGVRDYETREAADLAISRAAVSYGRQLANLPPLPEPARA